MISNKSTGIVLIQKAGAPDVLKYQTITLQPPGPGQVLINQKAIGVNFVDVFFRNGTFPLPAYPSPVGLEASGIIEAVGAGVKDFAVGNRVAYHSSSGAYAQKRILNTTDIFKLPDNISFEQAASVMVKGLTAHMLLKDSHPVKPGQVVFIHAVTGGVGTLLSQWAKYLGAHVIGAVGSAAKKELAIKRGLKNVIDLQSENFAQRTKIITGGKGVDVVYDSIGAATFNQSVQVVKDGGSVILYGWPTGMPVADADLLARRKINFIHPALNNYLAHRQKISHALAEVFDLVQQGILHTEQPMIYPLRNAAQAHADLESRKTTGSIILQP